MLKGIYPGFIEVKYNYINVEGIYVSTIAITDYMTEINMIETVDKLMDVELTNIMFHVQRKNNTELLKKLTNIIAESGSEKKSVSKNQIDINILDNIKEQAVLLRKKIQIDGEQIYTVSTYLVLKGKNEQEVIKKTKAIINKLYSCNIIAKTCNFKQKQAYIASIPLALEPVDLSKNTQITMTESALAKMFPFYTKSFMQEDGIILGRMEKEVCILDTFSSKNNNYNMCVFGSSGAGKSYFVKLNIIRNAYKGLRQIIIDPEGEYVDLVNSLGGIVYTEDNYNPLVIPESYVASNKDFFNNKIENVIEYLKEKYDIRDIKKLRRIIEQLYYEKGIDEDKESLYIQGDNTMFFSSPRYTTAFPTVEELNCKLVLEGLLNKEKVRGKYKKIDVEAGKLFCFNLKNKNQEEINKLMKIYIPKIYELIEKETIIYFDEVWKCMGDTRNRYVIDCIYNMFKTLRKLKAAIVIISQDISDLFNLDEGRLGKSILNNSNIKAFFKMEWEEVETLNKMGFDKKSLEKIKMLEKAKTYIKTANTSFVLDIEATKYEHMLIEGECK